MIEQAQVIKDFCDKEDFDFVFQDKLPNINRAEEEGTIYIKGFNKGSKRLTVMYGGLKSVVTLKVPIEQIDVSRRNWLPDIWHCARCQKKTLHLRTDDNHKTYVCKDCYKEKEVIVRNSSHE